MTAKKGGFPFEDAWLIRLLTDDHGDRPGALRFMVYAFAGLAIGGFASGHSYDCAHSRLFWCSVILMAEAVLLWINRFRIHASIIILTPAITTVLYGFQAWTAYREWAMLDSFDQSNLGVAIMGGIVTLCACILAHKLAVSHESGGTTKRITTNGG